MPYIKEWRQPQVSPRRSLTIRGAPPNMSSSRMRHHGHNAILKASLLSAACGLGGRRLEAETGDNSNAVEREGIASSDLTETDRPRPRGTHQAGRSQTGRQSPCLRTAACPLPVSPPPGDHRCTTLTSRELHVQGRNSQPRPRWGPRGPDLGRTGAADHARTRTLPHSEWLHSRTKDHPEPQEPRCRAELSQAEPHHSRQEPPPTLYAQGKRTGNISIAR